MSYLDRARDPRRRNSAITAVIVIHAVVGYVLVTGLSFTGFVNIPKFIPTIEFTSPPPIPTPPDDTAPPETPATSDPFVAPPKPIDLSGTVLTDVKPFDPIPIPDPVLPAKPFVTPTPTGPAFAPKRAVPRGDPARWVLTDDYPTRLIRQGVEGIAGFRVVVGSDGRVDACEITASSGNAQLDAATCRNVTRRARFDPASDGNGQKVVGSYSGTVHWVLPN